MVTCLNPSYSAQVLARLMQCPKIDHWVSALRAVRYLKGNPSQGNYHRTYSALRLYIFCDSDWTGHYNKYSQIGQF